MVIPTTKPTVLETLAIVAEAFVMLPVAEYVLVVARSPIATLPPLSGVLKVVLPSPTPCGANTRATPVAVAEAATDRTTVVEVLETTVDPKEIPGPEIGHPTSMKDVSGMLLIVVFPDTVSPVV
jgi:hypothetical protein